MRLDLELVRRKECESRQEAQECIKQGFIVVDGTVVTKSTRQVGEASVITVTQRRKYVSRGGDKLEGAILHVYPDASGSLYSNKNALDVGSSTGGFTECLLTYGVTHITAIDVGTSQLHQKLRNNSHVLLYENTDIRNFVAEIPFDIIVADVSFIALEKIIEKILSFGHTDTEYFLLIKPQFEVGFGNTKKGIVKDIALIDEVLQKYSKILVDQKCKAITLFPSSIKGGDGNQEYFIHFIQ